MAEAVEYMVSTGSPKAAGVGISGAVRGRARVFRVVAVKGAAAAVAGTSVMRACVVPVVCATTSLVATGTWADSAAAHTGAVSAASIVEAATALGLCHAWTAATRSVSVGAPLTRATSSNSINGFILLRGRHLVDSFRTGHVFCPYAVALAKNHRMT